MKVILLSLVVVASIKASASEYKQFYIDASGRQMEAADAIISSIKGNEVYKCQSVETKVSKSGTSIGIKNIKKPKAN